jgi:2-keto-4-pentenoate hydratase/2-oxohepta-3-ene-1,7-dioic acid hydratase in catechol pathway
MKLARFNHNNSLSYGAIEGQNMVSLPNLAFQLQERLPPALEEFVAQDQTALATAETLMARAKAEGLAKFSFSLGETQLLAPVASPPKIVLLGWNYFDHTAERKVDTPDEPVFFMKPQTAIVGPGDKILKRPFVTQLDYEGELAVVIGKKCKDVSAEQAADCIFGYTILNDVSARNFQFKDKQWTRGKGFDTFAPTGPCITTRTQMPETSNVGIKTWVNGELRQNGSTRDMIFSVAQIIYHLSRVMTLEPCDIISTGTPSGVAMAMKEPKWLKDGDVVRIEIEGIGTLENTVQEA